MIYQLQSFLSHKEPEDHSGGEHEPTRKAFSDRLSIFDPLLLVPDEDAGCALFELNKILEKKQSEKDGNEGIS